jgi:hypothetical protein
MWQEILVPLGAAALGAFVGPLLANTKDRRAARSAVYTSLHKTTRAWQPDNWEVLEGELPHTEMEREMAEFGALAIIARVPRARVERYTKAQRDAYNDCELDTSGRISTARTPERHLLEISEAQRAIVGHLWHPWLYPVGAAMAAMWRRLAAAAKGFWDVPTQKSPSLK